MRFFSLAIAPVLLLGYSMSGLDVQAAIIVQNETLAPANADNFTTISTPSNSDAGQSATVAQHSDSPTAANSPNFSNYLALNNGVAGVANGNGLGILYTYANANSELQFYYDLGSPQSISQINAYSYNTDTRAPLSFTVWGANSLLSAGSGGGVAGSYNSLSAAGWTQIVGVGTPTVVNRQSGVQITDTTGTLGTYRYLLFSNRPNVEGQNTSSYFREIDIYTGPATPSVANLVVANPSFETGGSGSAPSIGGWTVSGGTSSFADAIAANTVNWPAPEGTQARGFRANSPSDPITVSQVLGTLSAEGTYSLSYFVADRIPEAWLNYKVELLAGSNVLISEDSTSNAALRPFNGSTSHPSDVLFGAEGDWLNVVLQGTATSDMTGLPLTIRFTSTTQSTGDNGSNYDFALDNVQLSFAAVPEPSTLVLGGLALLGFAGVGLRRRRQQA